MAEAGVFGKRDQQSGAMASPFVGTPLGLGQCFDRGAVRSICLDDTYPAERSAQVRTSHPAPADPCRETLSDSERGTITAVGQVLSMSRHRGIVPAGHWFAVGLSPRVIGLSTEPAKTPVDQPGWHHWIAGMGTGGVDQQRLGDSVLGSGP